MQTVTLEEAQSRLAEIIENLPPGEEIVITRDNQPVARLVRTPNQGRPGPGLGKGMLTVVSDDDDDHLKDFAEYMPPEGD
jgi:antitoxin (DNA-binding transcriptional repressor) of toxin-antitoxin stability system